MFGRKRAHLVERAVEHLAQSGELEESAVHLLEPERAGSAADARPPPPAVTETVGLMDHSDGATVTVAAQDPAESQTMSMPLETITHEAAMLATAPAAADDPAQEPATPEEGQSAIPPEEGGGQPFVDMTSLFRAGMIDWNRVRSRVSEEFRLVQRQIVRTAFTAAGAEPGFSNLLMITSSIPGEGKSFTSLNLAACIARQRDHYVLLIDIDSKRDSFCMALGLGDAPGLLDLAANPDIDPSQVIAKTAIEHLSVLPIGIERDLGPELFASKQMTKLIQALGRRYADRLIVLDAPPTLSTSDPAALAPIVGQVMFVVEAERTQREEVESSLDLLQACPTITLLLNKVQVQTRYTFGAYSTYYTS
jgi:receptor protein-tyrosine kinase